MAQGLNINRLVRTSVSIAPQSAQRRSFGILLIATDNDGINGLERIKSFTDLESVAITCGINSPAYKAAALYYAQQPKPFQLLIGRWLRIATSGLLIGGKLTTAEKNISLWSSITDGSFTISIDGVSQDVLGLDFSSQLNLNGVASVITAEMTGASVTYNGSNFVCTSATTGVTSSVSFATPAVSGTDISLQLRFTSALALPLVPGYAPETPLECVQALADLSSDWYGITFAASVMPADDDNIDIATYIEGVSIARTFGITTSDTGCLSSVVTTDICSRLKDLGIKRTDVQYSSTQPYSICSYYARAFTTDFNANNSLYTLMYKQEPGVIAEYLSNTEADALKSKNGNVFVNYKVGNGNVAIIQYETCPDGTYFDEKHGLDWFANATQTEVFNGFYTSLTKIPQTEEGQNQLIALCTQVCQEAINNGLIAPGTWNSDGFPGLTRGQRLPLGFFIYSDPIDDQLQAIREQRIAPPILIALKLKGALQEADILINVNR